MAGRLCGIPAADVQEIVFLPELTQLPGQPPIVEGFLNLRGSAVPVVKLDRVLEVGNGPLSLHTPLLIFVRADLAAAVDRVEEVAFIAPDEFRAAGKDHSFNDCAAAEFPFAGRAATLLDSSRILLEKERQCVAGLRQQAQARLNSLGTPAE